MARNRNSNNPARIIHEFGNLQDHLYNHVIRHELTHAIKSIKDPKIIAVCQEIANYFGIEIKEYCKNENLSWYKGAVKNLVNHLKKANEKYAEILSFLPEYDKEWTEGLFKATEKQLIYLSELFIKLDCEPSVYDREGNEILPGSLVAYPCEDQEGRYYEHYGVVMHSSKGLVVKHFFSGPTVKGRNSLVEEGIGYVHSVPYSSEWLFKDHPPENVTYQDIQKRIEISNQIKNKIWNKFKYNCEHWAREMVTSIPECIQIDKFKNNKKSGGSNNAS
jgi:hypothetical protein